MATIKSIEEKAKAYDEAIEIAKEINNEQRAQPFNIMTKVFPELKESEDEKLRKQVVYAINQLHVCECTKNKLLAWLEKQGEKPNNVYDKELSEILYRVIRRYINDPNIPYTERERVSMEIIPYMERLEKQGEQKPYGQRQECVDCQFNYAGECKGSCGMKQGGQKPAWSEEDERIIDNLISQLGNLYTRKLIKKETKDKYVNWLKSLRPQTTWKPSDEQTEALDGICSYIRNKADWEISQDTIHQLYSLSEQLKKLKG